MSRPTYTPARVLAILTLTTLTVVYALWISAPTPSRVERVQWDVACHERRVPCAEERP